MATNGQTEEHARTLGELGRAAQKDGFEAAHAIAKKLGAEKLRELIEQTLPAPWRPAPVVAAFTQEQWALLVAVAVLQNELGYQSAYAEMDRELVAAAEAKAKAKAAGAAAK